MHRISGQPDIRPAKPVFFIFGIRPDTGFDLPDIRHSQNFQKFILETVTAKNTSDVFCLFHIFPENIMFELISGRLSGFRPAQISGIRQNQYQVHPY
jgi:hypothetical protein